MILLTLVDLFDGVELTQTLGLILCRNMDPRHSNTVLHWPPHQNLEIWIRLQERMYTLSFIEEFKKLIPFTNTFVLSAKPRFNELVYNLFEMKDVGFDMHSFILDMNCSRKQGIEEREEKLTLMYKYGLKGFCFTAYPEDFSFGLLDMVTLAYQ